MVAFLAPPAERPEYTLYLMDNATGKIALVADRARISQLTGVSEGCLSLEVALLKNWGGETWRAYASDF